MTAVGALVEFTLRGLLGRRRFFLLLLLAAVPILIALLIRVAGGQPDPDRVLDTLVVRAVMPLVALIVGTAAMGSEIEDGTAVYLMIKPVARTWIALSKVAVAAGFTAALVVPGVIVTGVLLSGARGFAMSDIAAFGLACLAGGTAYAAVFVALSVFTSRALLLGLAYILLWEGVLAGLLEGTRFLSIRQATLGLAEGLGARVPGDTLEAGVSGLVLVVATVAAFALTTLKLTRFEVRGGD